MLTVKNLGVSYGSLKIIDDVSFSVQANQWLMIAGPNGAGKSTIVKAVTQGIPYCGKVFWKEKDVSHIRPVKLAKQIGVLTQNHSVGYSFSVEEIVKLGRYAWSGGFFSSLDNDSDQKVNYALEITGMNQFRDHSVLTLSGGELQRTFLAQVFAQDPQLLILDEPTNHLDLVYQKQMFELIREWLKQPERAVISVVHDLSLAKNYGTHALLMNKGKVAAFGETDKVLGADNLSEVYSMDVYQWMQDILSCWQSNAKGI